MRDLISVEGAIVGETAHDLRDTLDAFDRAFMAGDLETFIGYFARDAQLLIHQQPDVSGRAAIRSSFAEVFQLFDTSAYVPTYEIIDVRDDAAYVLVSFTEILRPRDGQQGLKIQGRNVQFWRHEEGGWRIVMLLTARSAPDVPAR